MHLATLDMLCIVYALGYSGHALCHAGFLQLGVECPVCVLEATVTVAQWCGSRIRSYCLIECIEDERIVIAVSNYI